MCALVPHALKLPPPLRKLFFRDVHGAFSQMGGWGSSTVKVELGGHQKFSTLYLSVASVIMTAAAVAFGVFRIRDREFESN
jgi:hypothetical protein